MFLKKKYVLVKEHEEINWCLKVLAAALILVTVFATPILLDQFVKYLQGGGGTKEARNCTRKHGCSVANQLDNVTELYNLTDDDLDRVKPTSTITDDDLDRIKPTSTITPLDNDDYYDYTDGILPINDKMTTEMNEYKQDLEYTTYEYDDDYTDVPKSHGFFDDLNSSQIVDKFFNARNNLDLSTLGDILFKRAPYSQSKDRQFKILIWKEGPFLVRRHINYFTSVSHDPFAECSVKNCILSYNDEDISSADAVVFLLLRQGADTMPVLSEPRPENQRWIFLTDENPFNTFKDKSLHWENYNGIFNWSMSYRMKSDIPVANARVVPAPTTAHEATIKDLIPNYDNKQRDVLVAAFLNDCSMENSVGAYIRSLQTHIQVDVYGKCANTAKKCPSHFAKDCPELNKYMFYFTFENAHCREAISQKSYWNTYEKGAIPIVAGIYREDCEMLFPPESYLHITDYTSPDSLANHILQINRTWDDSYWRFHKWRKYFNVVNEHGYFGSQSRHYCRICEGLNYNSDERKVYDNLSDFLSPEKNCMV